jgi:predicted ATPase
MSDATFITRVALENYRSIATCDVALGPLTFLVGPNGAGKSNFLDALWFVRDGLVGSLDHAFRMRGGSRQVVHHGAAVTVPLGFRLAFTLPSGIPGTYAFRITHSHEDPVSGRWEVAEEECRVHSATADAQGDFFRVQNGQVTSSVGTMPAGTSDRLYLVRASGVPQFREVHDALCDMQFYQIVPGSIPDIDTFDPAQRLRLDGSNLASVFNALQLGDRETKARIEEFLQIVLPTLRKVSVAPVLVDGANQEVGASVSSLEASRIALVFHQKVGRTAAPFGPVQMSEGTLRTLAILTALYQANQKGRPTLTAIEDVEAAVHPGALRVILDALQEASLTTQVLVATHSPELLDEKDVAAESILAVAADDGVTRIGPLTEGDRTVVRDRLFTVGQLLRATRLEPDGNGAARTGETPPHFDEGAGT